MGTGTFTVIAGDFSKQPDAHRITGTKLKLRKETAARSFRLQLSSYEKVPTSEIASLEVASAESDKNFTGSAAAALAGGLLLGPVGALAGALSGGNGNLVTFVLTLRDGRRALCTAKSTAFRMFQAAVFR